MPLIQNTRARRAREKERFIRSLMPVLYAPLWKRDGSPFISDDGYGHTCTVTDAPRSIQGRGFNATSSKIVVPDHVALRNLTKSTYIACINPTSLGEGNAGALFMKATASGAGYGLRLSANSNLFFTRNFDGGSPYRNSANNTIALNKKQVVACTWNGTLLASGIKFFLDGAELAYGTSGDGVGALVTDAAHDLIIGNTEDNASTFGGLIIEGIIYDTVLSQPTISYISSLLLR